VGWVFRGTLVMREGIMGLGGGGLKTGVDLLVESC
jgi:hypothetical protein